MHYAPQRPEARGQRIRRAIYCPSLCERSRALLQYVGCLRTSLPLRDETLRPKGGEQRGVAMYRVPPRSSDRPCHHLSNLGTASLSDEHGATPFPCSHPAAAPEQSECMGTCREQPWGRVEQAVLAARCDMPSLISDRTISQQSRRLGQDSSPPSWKTQESPARSQQQSDTSAPLHCAATFARAHSTSVMIHHIHPDMSHCRAPRDHDHGQMAGWLRLAVIIAPAWRMTQYTHSPHSHLVGSCCLSGLPGHPGFFVGCRRCRTLRLGGRP